MKVSCVLVVSSLLVVLAPVVAAAQPLSRVRALDDLASAAVDRGLSHSAAFRRLVEEIEASDLIVHVLTKSSLPPGIVGTTRMSFAGASHRYVRIVVDAGLSPEDHIVILGHELQHACEIARSRARNTAAIRSLYRLIGRKVSSTQEAYETSAAIEAGAQVWFDLHHGSRSMRATQEK